MAPWHPWYDTNCLSTNNVPIIRMKIFVEDDVIGYRVLKHNYFPKVSIWWFFGFWNAYTSACDISLLESIFLRGMGICNVDKPSISRMLLHAKLLTSVIQNIFEACQIEEENTKNNIEVEEEAS